MGQNVSQIAQRTSVALSQPHDVGFGAEEFHSSTFWYRQKIQGETNNWPSYIHVEKGDIDEFVGLNHIFDE